MTQADTSHRGIAKAALGIEWENTESVARRVAEYAADLVQGIESQRDNLRIEAKGYADTIGIMQALASEGLPIEIGGRRYVAEAEVQAAIAAAMMGAVKPLEWVKSEIYKSARSDFGGYTVQQEYDVKGNTFWAMGHADILISDHDTEYEAICAAQANYNARILSALSIPTDATAALDAVKAQVREDIARWHDSEADRIFGRLGDVAGVHFHRDAAAAIRAMKGGATVQGAGWRDPSEYTDYVNSNADELVQVLCEVVRIDAEGWDHVSIGDHTIGDKFVSIGFVSDDVDMVDGEWVPGWLVAGWNMSQDCFTDARGFRVIGWQPLSPINPPTADAMIATL